MNNYAIPSDVQPTLDARFIKYPTAKTDTSTFDVFSLTNYYDAEGRPWKRPCTMHPTPGKIFKVEIFVQGKNFNAIAPVVPNQFDTCITLIVSQAHLDLLLNSKVHTASQAIKIPIKFVWLLFTTKTIIVVASVFNFQTYTNQSQLQIFVAIVIYLGNHFQMASFFQVND